MYGDVLAEWIARGTLNILGQDVNLMPTSAWRGDACQRLILAQRHTVENATFSGAPTTLGDYGTIQIQNTIH